MQKKQVTHNCLVHDRNVAHPWITSFQFCFLVFWKASFFHKWMLCLFQIVFFKDNQQKLHVLKGFLLSWSVFSMFLFLKNWHHKHFVWKNFFLSYLSRLCGCLKKVFSNSEFDQYKGFGRKMWKNSGIGNSPLTYFW